MTNKHILENVKKVALEEGFILKEDIKGNFTILDLFDLIANKAYSEGYNKGFKDREALAEYEII